MTANPRAGEDHAQALLGAQPVGADADVDRQRRVDRERLDHLAAGQLGDCVGLGLRALEQELVVDLQDQPDLEALRPRAPGGS